MEEAKSNLCKSLTDILNDKHQLSMLPYFIQYMEEAKAVHLVQFWFSVEAFRTAAALITKPDVFPSSYHNNSCSSNNSTGEGCCSCDAGHKPVTMTSSSSIKLYVNDKVDDISREKKLLHSKYHWETSSFMAQKSLSCECVSVRACVSMHLCVYVIYILMCDVSCVYVSSCLACT